VRSWLEREPTKASAENAKSSDQRRGVQRTLNTATESLYAVSQALKRLTDDRRLTRAKH